MLANRRVNLHFSQKNLSLHFFWVKLYIKHPKNFYLLSVVKL